MMTRLIDSLVNNFNFTFDNARGVAFRTWEKETEVAWLGIQKLTYSVQVSLLPSGDAVSVSFLKDGMVHKTKRYSFGAARTLNAIKATVNYNGYEF